MIVSFTYGCSKGSLMIFETSTSGGYLVKQILIAAGWSGRICYLPWKPCPVKFLTYPEGNVRGKRALINALFFFCTKKRTT
jgi:hypothetical protein